MKWSCVFLALWLVRCAPAPTPDEAPLSDAQALQGDLDLRFPLLPRGLLFDDPDHLHPRLSPSGAWISFLAPHQGELQLKASPSQSPGKARPLTQAIIGPYSWTYDDDHLLVLQHHPEDDGWHLHRRHPSGDVDLDLTPNPGAVSRVIQLSHQRPHEALILTSDHAAPSPALALLDLRRPQHRPIAAADGLATALADLDLRPLAALSYNVNDNLQILRAGPGEPAAWPVALSLPLEEAATSRPLGLDASGQELLLLTRDGQEFAALLGVRLDSGARRTLAQAPEGFDLEQALLHPATRAPLGWSWIDTRRRWAWADPAEEGHARKLAALDPGDLSVLSRSLDNQRWLVSFERPDAPTRYALYDRASGAATPLFTDRAALEGAALGRAWPVELDAHGVALRGYLTLPPWEARDRPARPLPLVVTLGDGPSGQAAWRWDAEHQWLANRGYAALRLNLRGSSGRGRGFAQAVDGRWGGDALRDLTAALDWAAREKIAAPGKVALLGEGYGGFTALAMAAAHPERVACVVDHGGPLDLLTWWRSLSAASPAQRALLTRAIGDPDAPGGRDALAARSPLSRAAAMRRPVLLTHGARDPRLPHEQVLAFSQEIAPKLLTWATFTDEGAAPRSPLNLRARAALTEAFLAQHLGGRLQPFDGDLWGSSLEVHVGADAIPDLPQALEELRATRAPDPQPDFVK